METENEFHNWLQVDRYLSINEKLVDEKTEIIIIKNPPF